MTGLISYQWVVSLTLGLSNLMFRNTTEIFEMYLKTEDREMGEEKQVM